MMKIRLLQLDGKTPNIALMRLAHYHKQKGDEVLFHHADSVTSVHSDNFGSGDRIYASTIFTRTKPLVGRLLMNRPDAIVGGTGFDAPPLFISSLEAKGVHSLEQDYSIYPNYQQSIGFTQRGCRLKCEFCVVPLKEGKVKSERSIWQIWRGYPWPKELVLLDNDFFGQSDWRGRVKDIREGGFKVCFNQGINARCITDEAAEAIASVNYRDDQMKDKRLYTAWDNREDEERLFTGLKRLVKYGVKPDHIMVYMLCGYWPGETQQDREYRRRRLRDFGCRPYPMVYNKTKELIGFQRWVIRRADLKCSWEDFVAAGYRPEKVGIMIEKEGGEIGQIPG
jgi:hypothetical protein